MGKSTDAIKGRLDALRSRNAGRDKRQQDLLAVRSGEYERIAGDLLPEDFDRPFVANLVDTAARDTAEVMAPLPAVACSVTHNATQKAKDFAAKRGQIANSFVQGSRLQNQMFAGCDRFNSFGFMALRAKPDFREKRPTICVETASRAYYLRDYHGRVLEYYTVAMVPVMDLCAQFPYQKEAIENSLGYGGRTDDIEVVTYEDDYETVAFLPEKGIELLRLPNPITRCPVTIVERPYITSSVQGQYDDVIWVQIARAMVQAYMMSALEQSVNAPMAVPDDVNQVTVGPLEVLQSKDPGGIGRVPLNIPQGIWPAAESLVQEQRVGSRYPEGRSGSIDASIVTGQGVQALMGTFDTQIQTFQKLAVPALEDVISMCFEMDEKLWPNVAKTVRIKDSGAPYEVEYTPAKDIKGDYTVDVSYGAIAGLDPNRGLVFVLQALAAKLISTATARKSLPIEIDANFEDEQVALEAIRESTVASIAMLAQAIPMMATQGQDPREVVLQIGQVVDLIEKGAKIEDAVEKVFAPKQEPVPENPAAALAAPATPGAPTTPGQDLLMGIAGLSPGGDPNLQANVSTRTPI